MAVSRPILLPLCLAALACCLVLHVAFVSGAPARSSLRGMPNQMVASKVAMQAGPVSSEEGGIGEGTYIIGMSVFMIASVLANTNGFFGPW